MRRNKNYWRKTVGIVGIVAGLSLFRPRYLLKNRMTYPRLAVNEGRCLRLDSRKRSARRWNLE